MKAHTMPSKVRKLSGLQKEVLKLYRMCIRAAYTKPEQNRPHFLRYTREEFNKFQGLPKKEFSTIEHLLRAGYKKYEMLSAPEIKDIK